MNSENRYPVTASLFMLREIKHRQEQVHRGHQLLKRKAEALRLKGRQTANELSALQAILGHKLKEAYISLAAVKFSNGDSNAMVLENIEEAQVRVQRVAENVSGVSTVSLLAIEDPTASDALRFSGLGAGGHRTSEAKKAFREAVRILIKFASLRKVNGIEKVIMPKLHNTEIYIMTEMDELEREEFHRLKMVKAKKVHGCITASLKFKGAFCSCAGSDIGCDRGIMITPSTYNCTAGQHPPRRVVPSTVYLEDSTNDYRPHADYRPSCLQESDDDDVLF